jgi:flagellar motor switch protein FliG
MTIIVIGTAFAVIWLGTTFFIFRYIKRLNNDLLKKFLGAEKPSEKESENIPEKKTEKDSRPFDFIRSADPSLLLNFIQQEHPQVIALVLAHLGAGKAALILQNLNHDVQSDVSRRIACMDRVSPEVMRRIERVLEEKLITLSGEDYSIAGGVESIVEILNLVDHVSQKQIIEAMEDGDPELTEEIKKRMFVFEDIVMLDDQSIQKILRGVESQELAKALKSVDTEVQDKIFRNMSQRTAGMLKENMDKMGPIRLKDVEEAQKNIVSIIRHLEDIGEIVVARF